jgi:hypothetical protein
MLGHSDGRAIAGRYTTTPDVDRKWPYVEENCAATYGLACYHSESGKVREDGARRGFQVLPRFKANSHPKRVL